MTFQPFLRHTITIPLSALTKYQVLSKIQIELYQPFPADSDYSLVPFWTIQSHLLGLSESKSTSISIHGQVDLGLFAKTVEKDFSIHLSSIDSERIHSPCT